ncbi:MAG: HAD-IIA family hydrolase [Oricola sp.]
MHDHPIRAAVFDIDGTLAMMDKATGTYTALPGAVDAVNACRAAGIATVAYTNGTFFPPAHYFPRLADAGFVFEPGHVLTPAVVAAHHLAETGHKRVMVLGVEGTTVPMTEAGFDVVAPAPGSGPVDAILVGWTREFSLAQLEALVQAVWDGAMPYVVSDAPYFAGAKGRMLGVSGAIGAMIRQTTDVTPVVLGKPSVLGMEMIEALTGAACREMVVVGDDPSLEPPMARKVGALAIGVTTGLSDSHAFMRAEADKRAHFVMPSLEGFADQEWLREAGRKHDG